MSSTQTGHIRQKFAAHLVSELLVWLPLIDSEEPRRAIEALQMIRTVLELEDPERDWDLAHATAIEAKESFGTEGRLQTACRAACEAAELVAGAFMDLSSCAANLDQAAWKVTFATQNICLTAQEEFCNIGRIALNYGHARNRAKILQLATEVAGARDTWTAEANERIFGNIFRLLLPPLQF